MLLTDKNHLNICFNFWIYKFTSSIYSSLHVYYTFSSWFRYQNMSQTFPTSLLFILFKLYIETVLCFTFYTHQKYDNLKVFHTKCGQNHLLFIWSMKFMLYIHPYISYYLSNQHKFMLFQIKIKNNNHLVESVCICANEKKKLK